MKILERCTYCNHAKWEESQCDFCVSKSPEPLDDCTLEFSGASEMFYNYIYIEEKDRNDINLGRAYNKLVPETVMKKWRRRGEVQDRRTTQTPKRRG